MIAMAVASILILGVGAAYSALGKASHRLAVAQAGLGDRHPPRCRPEVGAAPSSASRPTARYRCTLAERCEYDTVSQSCRPTTPPRT
jgi:hypothetical protein